MNPIHFVVCLILIPSALLAQKGTLTGKVTDASGALVAGAEIAISTPGKRLVATVSGSEGTYSFSSLSPGDYTLQATAPNLALPKPLKLTIHAGAPDLRSPTRDRRQGPAGHSHRRERPLCQHRSLQQRQRRRPRRRRS